MSKIFNWYSVPGILMPPGTYPIEVNQKGTVDGQCLKTNPETLVLTVKTPDGGDMLAAEIDDPSALDMGHMAGIVIEEKFSLL